MNNTVMKEFFSWHSTLKPEDAFPARTQNDNARQDTILWMQILTSKDINIYVHLYVDNVNCCYVTRRYLKQRTCATGE